MYEDCMEVIALLRNKGHDAWQTNLPGVIVPWQIL